ncbi:MAG: T9SS type A sorting domain-containing protein [Candidatus Marinimicrobia bacterium]|nr:T9SS type A sorting domain-containing protein [Candidatus Neomarinimicrobiota bacterium]
MTFISRKCNILISFLFVGMLFGEDSWKIYDDSEIANIEITVDPEALIWIYNNVQSDSLHLATVHFQNAFVDDTIDSVGFRLRGNTSRNAQKKSFKLDFNHFVSGQEFYDLEKMNLNGEHNDPSIIRSKLCWDFYQEIGVKSTRASHAKVFINDEYYGLYISIEHIDDTFLKRNYENDSGNLWKCIWPADLTYRGNSPEDYHPYYDDERPYQLKTNKDEYDYSKLARLIRVIHDSPDSLEMVLNVKKALQYFAVNILTGSWDDYRFLRNNFYLYHNPADDLIHWIPYDYDNSFSIDWFDIDWSSINPYEYAVIDGDGRPLTDYLFSETRYKNLFTHFLEFYMNTSFNNVEWNDQLDHWQYTFMSAAQDDEWRTMDYGYTMWDFTASYGYDYQNQHTKQGIKTFIENRISSLDEQLYYSGESTFIYEVTPSHRSMLLNDIFSINASVFGPNGVDNVIYHYRVNSGNWETSSLSFSPIENTKKVEENDRWIGEAIMNVEGDVEWYLTAVKNGHVERYPVYGYKTLTVINSINASNIQINEILAKNDNTLADDYGEYDDWIEIINHGEIQVELDGFYLTDNLNQLTKWSFPFTNIVIEPDSFLIIWCDNDDEQGDLHTNFKLSSGGESFAIVSPDGLTILDSLTFPNQTEDVSFGRTQDDLNPWDFMTPTPGYENGTLLIENNKMPNKINIHNAFPNPFNPTTTLQYGLPEDAKVSVMIYDLMGREIKTLVNIQQSSGFKSVVWDATNDLGQPVSAGMYIYRISSGDFHQMKKIVLLK